MDENQLTIVKKYEIIKPLIHKIDSLIDNCYRDCLDKYFHTFKYDCIYDINLTNITKNEIKNSTSSDKNLGLYDLNKKLTVARKLVFWFNQIKKPTIKIYSDQRI